VTKRVLALVEGQTEERFVKDVIAPHLISRDVFVIPKIVTTKRVKQGPDFKGGITEYAKVERDLRRLLGDSDVASVTTFIDYYGLPSEFPGIATRPVGPPLQRALHVESEWYRRIDHPRFRPFLMVQEFEALLFSRPEELGKALYQPSMVPQLKEVRDAFSTPEDINDDPATTPSKRISGIFPAYRKTLFGPLVAGRIGLDTLRAECPHFNEWVTWLESI
jgi:hypothetical protein